MRQLQLVSPSPSYSTAFLVLKQSPSYYYYYYITPLRVFHTSANGWSHTVVWVTTSVLNSPGLLVFLAYLIDIVLMVSTCLHISRSSSPCNNPLVTVPRAPITIGIAVNFMFLSFFSSRARSIYLSFFSLFKKISVCGLPGRQSPLFSRLSFLWTITWSGRLVVIRWSFVS